MLLTKVSDNNLRIIRIQQTDVWHDMLEIALYLVSKLYIYEF